MIAIGGAGALALTVAIVLLTGGGEASESAAKAPSRCVQAWNDDREALAYGVHNFGTHGYQRVRVTMLSETGEEPAAGRPGVCAVLFGALELDSEPVAAGQLLLEGVWQPLSLVPGTDINRIAELQTIAYGNPNASLSGEGALVSD